MHIRKTTWEQDQIKDRHARVASIHGDEESGGHSKLLSRRFRGRSSLRKFLVSKEHLDWLKIDLNAAEIVLFKTIDAPKSHVNGSTYSVKAKSRGEI